jgi:hypothetical protein
MRSCDCKYQSCDFPHTLSTSGALIINVCSVVEWNLQCFQVTIRNWTFSEVVTTIGGLKVGKGVPPFFDKGCL